jgi:uncharacterized membrane protein YcaP (DUF421 family)
MIRLAYPEHFMTGARTVHGLWHTIWQDMMQFGVPWEEKAIRTIAVYVFLLIGLRLAGKRELGQLNPFDLIVLLVLSNTLQNAIIGNDNSLSGGVVGATILLIMNYLVVRFLYRHPALDRLIEGDPDVLIRRGEVLDHRLERELITKEQLEAAARRQGIDSLDQVDTCRLETGGALTFIPRAPTIDDSRHNFLADKLAAVEAGQAELSRQLASLADRLSPR